MLLLRTRVPEEHWAAVSRAALPASGAPDGGTRQPWTPDLPNPSILIMLFLRLRLTYKSFLMTGSRRKKSRSKFYMTFSSPTAFNILNQMLYGVASRALGGMKESHYFFLPFVHLLCARGHPLQGIPGCYAWGFVSGGVRMLRGSARILGGLLHNEAACAVGSRAGNMRKLCEYKPGLIWGSSPFT